MLILFAGGIETVTRERRWAKIANKLGYPSGRSVGSILKNHYERILYPFDVFKQGKTLTDIVSYFPWLLSNLYSVNTYLSFFTLHRKLNQMSIRARQRRTGIINHMGSYHGNKSNHQLKNFHVVPRDLAGKRKSKKYVLNRRIVKRSAILTLIVKMESEVRMAMTAKSLGNCTFMELAQKWLDLIPKKERNRIKLGV